MENQNPKLIADLQNLRGKPISLLTEGLDKLLKKLEAEKEKQKTK